MDNRIFNVNGSGLDFLTKTLEIAFLQEGRNTKAEGYVFDPEKGLILLWYISKYDKEVKKFLVPMTAKRVAPIIMEWLAGEDPKKMEFSDWDGDCDHDGHNSKGWRVYCEDWGHVGKYHGAIVAVRPAFMWHGK